MKYWGPYNSPGGINGNDPYVDGNPSAGIEGSIPTFHAFEQPMRGLQRLVAKSGFTPDPATDDQQIAQAVRSWRLNYFVDTGTPDALVVSTGGDPVLPAYSPGLALTIKKAATANATTTPTVQVDGLSAKTIIRPDGSPLAVGDLYASCQILVQYDQPRDKMILISPAGGGTSSMTLMEAAAFPNKMIWSTNGVYSWTVPTGVHKVRACVWGAGGGGGGALHDAAGGSGGGGGGYAEEVCTVTPGQVITVTVGRGGIGAAGGSNGNGTNGGSSSFGAFCSATGGLLGAHAGSNLVPGLATGVGGSGSGGDLNLSGTYGAAGGGDNDIDAEKWGGYGGHAAGGGGGGGYSSTGASGPGMWPGGGGSGGGGNSAISSPGGNGGDGGVIVYFVTPPS